MPQQGTSGHLENGGILAGFRNQSTWLALYFSASIWNCFAFAGALSQRNLCNSTI